MRLGVVTNHIGLMASPSRAPPPLQRERKSDGVNWTLGFAAFAVVRGSNKMELKRAGERSPGIAKFKKRARRAFPNEASFKSTGTAISAN